MNIDYSIIYVLKSLRNGTPRWSSVFFYGIPMWSHHSNIRAWVESTLLMHEASTIEGCERCTWMLVVSLLLMEGPVGMLGLGPWIFEVDWFEECPLLFLETWTYKIIINTRAHKWFYEKTNYNEIIELQNFSVKN